MHINIYYGGRGLIEDSTLYVLQKITNVLEELRVDVKRYNLYECKNEITALSNTIKEADGVILAADYSCNHCGMVWHWGLFAAVFGFLLAVC